MSGRQWAVYNQDRWELLEAKGQNHKIRPPCERSELKIFPITPIGRAIPEVEKLKIRVPLTELIAKISTRKLVFSFTLLIFIVWPLRSICGTAMACTYVNSTIAVPQKLRSVWRIRATTRKENTCFPVSKSNDNFIHFMEFSNVHISDRSLVLDLWRWVFCFPVLFDLMMALWSIETHSITMKNLALFRPKLSNFFSTNQIARFGQEQCCQIFNSNDVVD